MTALVLTPGAVTLADWKVIYRGAVPTLHPDCLAAITAERSDRHQHRDQG